MYHIDLEAMKRVRPDPRNTATRKLNNFRTACLVPSYIKSEAASANRKSSFGKLDDGQQQIARSQFQRDAIGATHRAR